MKAHIMMKQLKFTVALITTCCLLSGMAQAQLGIGVKVPQAQMHVHGGTVLSITSKLPPETSPFYAPVYNDDDSVQHAFKWMHDKAAVRFLGKGFYSVGIDTLNSGRFSFTAGYDNIARGTGGSSFGLRAHAEQTGAFASGWGVVSGYHLTFAQGYSTIASGPNCVSMGTNLENNSQVGCMIFGHSSFNAQSTTDHQFKAVFAGGYEFYSNAAITVGVLLSSGNNAWTVVSDARKKENFLPVRGDRFLQSISKMPLTSWNYKGQNARAFRHYGPMAQDFYKAFGKDAFGTIGSKTAINQADLDGVTLVAIQQLIHETDALEKSNDALAAEVETLRAKLSLVRKRQAEPYQKVVIARK
ncbi:tail fiber domain-containing protein [Dyadobacter sp. 676]|uniref:Tail fiber domain-containing protein n=1 Tax=Dyadobacter sp. 676 TaxID=3088362 RepID=A0AAU8FQ44_9BACT